MTEPNEDNPLRLELELEPEQEDRRRKIEAGWTLSQRKQRQTGRQSMRCFVLRIVKTSELPTWWQDIVDNLARDGERFA
jgi:hypothetical protein